MFSDAKEYVEMPTMPKIYSFLKQAKYKPPYIMESLAFHAIRTGYSGPISPSTTSVSIHWLQLTTSPSG